VSVLEFGDDGANDDDDNDADCSHNNSCVVVRVDNATGTTNLRLNGKPVVLAATTTTTAGERSNNGAESGSSTDVDGNDVRVWIAHKLPGEIVTERDPYGRPSLLERLVRGGVGKTRGGRRFHLKPVGRLDMMSEGLMLVTNSGSYARQMELPTNRVFRTYRVRAHGWLSDRKLAQIRNGVVSEGIRYAPMKVEPDDSYSGSGARSRSSRAKTSRKNVGARSGSPSTNKWLRVTCCEGKNRQIRKVFQHLGCKYAYNLL